MSGDLDRTIKYVATPTGKLFHGCNDPVRGVMGPVGSGKTVMGCMEVFSRAREQEPVDGVRRSRWAFIRNTYPELLTTTLKTWQEWVPASVCPVTRGAFISGTLRLEERDGTRVEAEMLFLALDREDDVRKLRSLELTGGFINEASEIRESVLDMLGSRIDRYPRFDKEIEGSGPTWTGIIMDTNPPSDRHWWYRLAEVDKPQGYRFFRQPPAIIKCPPKKKGDSPIYVPNDGSHGIPAAENVEHYKSGFEYYMRQVPGKRHDWLDVYLCGNYGTIMTGKAVYPEYSDTVHLAEEPLKPMRGVPLLLAWDFGLTPACVIMQQNLRGQIRILREFTSEDIGIENFAASVVRPAIRAEYGGMRVVSVGDPAGNQRSQTNETTCFQILAAQGIPTEPAPSNSFNIRREAVAYFLTKLSDGSPCFLLDPSCKLLRDGFISGYRYRKLRLAAIDGDRFTETPEKNEYSHPHDALQYGCSYFRTAHGAGGLQGGVKNDPYGPFGFGDDLTPGRRRVKVADTRGWT